MKRSLPLAILGVVLFTFGSAHADITTWDAWWIDDTPIGDFNWSFDWNTDTWDVWELYSAGGMYSSTTGCSGTADAVSIIHIVKTITNDSLFEWTDYHLEVSGTGVSYVAGSATSDTFGTITENGNIVDFFQPNSVPIGNDVTIAFDISVPAVFEFTLTQMPTPEPASLLLLGLAAACLRRR